MVRERDMKDKQVRKSSIKIIQGDITLQDTDAIVNAANTRLAPGGGVAGAIHKAAGPELWDECKSLGGCRTGEAKITDGYYLKAKYVIHTVGPVYSGSKNDAEQLASCYKNSLTLAASNHLKSISFPAISAGIFGYPMKEAASIAIGTTLGWLRDQKEDMLVQFVLYDDEARIIYENQLEKF